MQSRPSACTCPQGFQNKSEHVALGIDVLSAGSRGSLRKGQSSVLGAQGYSGVLPENSLCLWHTVVASQDIPRSGLAFPPSWSMHLPPNLVSFLVTCHQASVRSHSLVSQRSVSH